MKQIFLYIFILISIAIKAQGYNYNCATEIDTTEVKNNCERYKANNIEESSTPMQKISTRNHVKN